MESLSPHCSSLCPLGCPALSTNLCPRAFVHSVFAHRPCTIDDASGVESREQTEPWVCAGACALSSCRGLPVSDAAGPTPARLHSRAVARVASDSWSPPCVWCLFSVLASAVGWRLGPWCAVARAVWRGFGPGRPAGCACARCFHVNGGGFARRCVLEVRFGTPV